MDKISSSVLHDLLDPKRRKEINERALVLDPTKEEGKPEQKTLTVACTEKGCKETHSCFRRRCGFPGAGE